MAALAPFRPSSPSADNGLVLPTVFVAVYASLTAVIVFRLVFVTCLLESTRRQRCWSYRTGFNACACMWTTLRTTFWALLRIHHDNDFSPLQFEYLLFWMPHAIEFATFSLLGLFFVKALYRQHWDKHYVKCYTAYGSAVILVSSLIAVEAVCLGNAPNGKQSSSPSPQDYWTSAEAFTVGVVFFALSFLFLFTAVKVHALPPVDWSRTLVEQSQRLVTIVAGALFVVFFSRSVFNFVSGAGAVDIEIGSSNLLTNIAAFGVYAVWEIFPMVLLLVTVASGESVLPTAYRRRQFGVLGAGQNPSPHYTHHTDAQSSINSYEAYTESPNGLLSDNSGQMGHSLPIADDAPEPQRRSSSRWRRYRRRGSGKRVELEGGPKLEDSAEPLLQQSHSDSHDTTGSTDIRVSMPVIVDTPAAAEVAVSPKPRLDVSSSTGTLTRHSGNMKRGLAVGAKARVVSLGGEDSGGAFTPYGGEFGSYGVTGGYMDVDGNGPSSPLLGALGSPGRPLTRTKISEGSKRYDTSMPVSEE